MKGLCFINSSTGHVIRVFTLSIGTTYLLTILVLKCETVHSTACICVLNIAVCMANSVDPDQKVYSAASGSTLFAKAYLLQYLRVITVNPNWTL